MDPSALVLSILLGGLLSILCVGFTLLMYKYAAEGKVEAILAVLFVGLVVGLSSAIYNDLTRPPDDPKFIYCPPPCECSCPEERP